MRDLSNPHTVAYYAAALEAEQAEREFSEAYTTLVNSGAPMGSAEEYAMWSASGYADTAAALVRQLPVWEA